MASPATIDELTRPAPASVRWWKRLRWWLPAVIVFLLVAATLALFALSSSKERSEVREQVVADALLVRESIQFQLGRESEALQLLAADVGRESLAAAAIEARLHVFLRRAREVEGAALVDASMQSTVRAVRDGGRSDFLPRVPVALAEAAFAKARTLGRPVFSNAFQADWGASLALVVPVPRPAPEGLFLVAVYSLDRLLEEMVPWNLAQEYELSLTDVAGTVRARRVSAGPGRDVYTHQEALNLTGTPMLLGVNSVKGAPDWIANALRGGIAALAGVLLLSLWALWRDHERRVRAEHLARGEAAFRRAMGDSAVIGLRARDLTGRVTYVNPAFCEMVGFREDELVGREPPMPYWDPELLDEYRRRMDEILAGRASKAAYETRFRRRGGERFPAAIYDAPLTDADGRQVGWMSSILDLTEQKQSAERERTQQERLQTAARLTTMGEMASSLAHELNQPLGAIASYLAGSLNMLESGNASREELADALRKASAQAQRAGQVIRRVHEFVRKHEPKRVAVDLAALIEDCRPLVELQARRDGVRVQVSVEPGLPPIHGDPVMLQQVILNLTRNAIDAMAEVEPAQRRLVISAARAEEALRITVRDFGCGIPEAIADRLFSLFFTTKAEGMGMGLSICRSIVQAHDGRLWFQRLADGTEFHMQLTAAP